METSICMEQDRREKEKQGEAKPGVKKSDIIGKVNIRIYPFNKIKIF